jgi:hypothetical protein
VISEIYLYVSREGKIAYRLDVSENLNGLGNQQRGISTVPRNKWFAHPVSDTDLLCEQRSYHRGLFGMDNKKAASLVSRLAPP